MLEQARATAAARELARAAQLKSELPSIIENRVGAQMEKLENKLIKDFREMGERVIHESSAAISDQLNERIETLEQISNLQTRALSNLRDSSRSAEQKVSSVVNSIEKSLSEAVPGFQLEPSAFVAPQLEQPFGSQFGEMIRAEPRELEEVKSVNGFCPKCTSTNVRRAYRTGIWEEFLRLFFIAPFRCRSCRHKFYRF